MTAAMTAAVFDNQASFHTLVKMGAFSCFVFYVLSRYLYFNPQHGFSPLSVRPDGKATSRVAHRHAAYKMMVIPIIECYSMYLMMMNVGGWRAVLTMLHESIQSQEVALRLWREPLSPDAIWILHSFAVCFGLGFIHYCYMDPYVADRVWHKVFASLAATATLSIGVGNNLVFICVALWKPAGLWESIYTLISISGHAQHPLSRVYVCTVTVANGFSRLVLEPIFAFAALLGLYAAPWEEQIRYLPPMILAGFLTVLHARWAFQASQQTFTFLSGLSKKGGPGHSSVLLSVGGKLFA